MMTNSSAALIDQLFPTPKTVSTLGSSRSKNLLQLWQDGSFPILSNISVSFRIRLLLVVALIAAVVFGCVSFLGERKISKAMEEQASFRQMGTLASDVRSNALTLQTLEQEFFRLRDPAFADRHREVVASMSQEIQEIAALPMVAPMSQDIETMAKLVTALGTQFETVFVTEQQLGLTSDSGLRGALAKSVKVMEDELKGWQNQDALWNKMLSMRQAEKDFMIYGGTTYLGKFRKYGNEFDLKIDSSGLPPSTAETFRSLLSAYSTDMIAFVRASNALEGQSSELRGRMDELRPLVEKLFLFARDGVATSVEAQNRRRDATLRQVMTAGVSSLLLFCALSLLLSRSIVAPLRQIEDTMDRLSKGETGIAVPATWRKDEIGDMARAVEVFKENTLKMVSLQQDHQALMVAAEEERKVALRDLARGLESCTGETIGLIVERSARIVQTAAHMGDKIDSSTARSLTIAETSSRSEEQVNSVASATEQLTASIEEIGRNVSLSAQVAEEAVLEAEEAARRIQGLAVVASQIDDVVSMINAIARQTNMLAMNATIEAARAGVAGQGFAVVAKEVKNLATQTAQATSEIAQQVADVQQGVEGAVTSITSMHRTISRISEIATSNATAVEQQGAATREIAHNVMMTSEDTRSISNSVVEITQACAASYASAFKVLWSAQDIEAPVALLRQNIAGFLSNVYAA